MRNRFQTSSTMTTGSGGARTPRYRTDGRRRRHRSMPKGIGLARPWARSGGLGHGVSDGYLRGGEPPLARAEDLVDDDRQGQVEDFTDGTCLPRLVKFLEKGDDLRLDRSSRVPPVRRPRRRRSGSRRRNGRALRFVDAANRWSIHVRAAQGLRDACHHRPAIPIRRACPERPTRRHRQPSFGIRSRPVTTPAVRSTLHVAPIRRRQRHRPPHEFVTLPDVHGRLADSWSTSDSPTSEQHPRRS